MGGPIRDAEAALVERLLAGDDDARDELLALWLPVVLRWCNRLAGPRVDPEDAAHDVILVALRGVGSLRDPRAARSWLFGATRKVLAAHRRRAWVRRWVPGLPPEAQAGHDADPERRAHLSQLAELVQLALETVPTKQREVLVLFEVEGLELTEIAALVGAPLGTVKSRLRLGRERFRAVAERRHLDELALVSPKEIPL